MRGLPDNRGTRRALGITVAALALGAGALGLASARRRRSERRRVLSDDLSLEECERVHQRKVQRIARRLESHDGTRPVSLQKRSPPHQVPKANDRRRGDDKIDIGDLNRILHIDPERQVCVAEPGVTFVDLVEATLRHGLVPIVVPELETITIGGAVSGCSIESTSFYSGGFHDTCLEYEVITADGRVLRCTPDNGHALVFQMMHGAFGTLGVVSKLTFRLMPAKPFVRVRYEKYRRLEDYLAAIERRFHARDCDFMDGIIHSPSEMVLCIGHFVDEAPYTHRYDWVKVYYRTTRQRAEDFFRTADYFFRYDRGVTNPTPKSLLGRLLFGKLLGSTTLLRLADRLHWLLDADRPTITVDVFLPFSKVPEFMAWYRDEFGHFPLWCVPYKRVRDYEWLSPRFYAGMQDRLFLDLAIYGMKQRGGVNYHKRMEEKLLELGGVKTLISHNYYSEEDFWKTWNKENYEAAKAITDPRNVFRQLYAKTCKAAMGAREDAHR